MLKITPFTVTPMSREQKIGDLKRMLSQVAPEPGNLESLEPPETFALESPRTRAGPGGKDLASAARSALRKLTRKRDADLDEQETFALEAIILPGKRPVVLVHGNRYDALVAPWTALNAAAIRKRLAPLFASIGRIELPNSPLPYGGTGFVVGPNLMMTNRHVAGLFSQGLGSRIRYQAGSAAIDFRREEGMPAPQPATLLKVIGVELIHPYWDMALLRVDGLNGHSPLRLSVAAPQDLENQNIVVIGYPARDDRNDLQVQDEVFKRIYQVKRLQPGILRHRAAINSFENRVNALTHDSSTLGGNSGSAVINVDNGEVVGLHFAGVYLKSNYAVPAYELARDPRVVKTGVNFDGPVPPTADFDAAWSSADGEAAGPRPQPPGTASMSVAAPFPIRVDITVGGQSGAARGSESGAVATEGMKTPFVAGNLKSRTGYQADFLGLSGGAGVPLPKLTKRGKDAVATQSNGKEELKYHKFSIVMHQTRRLALFTAANVDWQPKVRLIKGRKPSRRQLTGLEDGDIEQWVTDDRLDAQSQLPDYFYTKDGGAFDKGHLVRRDDVVWGSTFEDMRKANGDTYHTTNCSPQVASFNRAVKGEDNWGDLEVLVQAETKAEKAILFSGPVLDDDDQVFTGKDGEGGTIQLKIPRKFWKIIVVKEQSKVGAYGFMLKQDLSGVPLEFMVPEAWRQYMAKIADIEAALGKLVDLSWLKKFDRFDSDSGESIRKSLE